jgi:hypothetical protein
VIAGYLAVLAILTVLCAAPLVLGSMVAVRVLPKRALVLWFGLLTALLVAALGFSAVGVLLMLV